MRKRNKRGRRASRFSPFGLGAIAVLLAAFAAVMTLMVSGGGVHVQVVFGTKLNEKGQTVYRVEREQGHQDMGSAETETPPPEAAVPVEKAAALLKKNEQAANAQTRGPPHPVTLAAKEPVDFTSILPRNWSERRGARPALLVVHDTESPNVAGQQDVLAIRAWFSNPRAQASSNYTTDAEGNTIRLVRETDKAWTQAFFNPWSISNELIGHASQTKWPDAQLRAAAQLFAASSARWGIPVRKGQVKGCTIVRSGILQHNDLGACGGGHHDAGPRFPIDRFIGMVAEYRNGGYHPKAPPKLVLTCTTAGVQRSLNLHGTRPRLATDGDPGPLTRRALARFQTAHHVAATGRPTAATGKALGVTGCNGRWTTPRPLAAGDFSVAPVFKEKSLWYEDISATGGFRGDRVKTTPGGPIKVVYLNPRDSRATREQRDQIAAQGFSVGLYTDPHWYGVPDPIVYRKMVDEQITRILRGAHDPVMLDFEQLPKSWVQAFLWGRAGEIGYRGRDGLRTGGTRPTRDTAYTNEPFQDGTVVPIPDLIAANLPWFVQLYYGAMQPAEPWWGLKQLVLWGYPIEGIFPFYDAAHYPPDWHDAVGGALFTSNRLTWLFQ